VPVGGFSWSEESVVVAGVVAEWWFIAESARSVVARSFL
jgi:hypothetical protein